MGFLVIDHGVVFMLVHVPPLLESSWELYVYVDKALGGMV